MPVNKPYALTQASLLQEALRAKQEAYLRTDRGATHKVVRERHTRERHTQANGRMCIRCDTSSHY